MAKHRISILIPYKPDYGHRDKCFSWLIKFYKQTMPQSEICIGESNQHFFSRSQAINHAARKANGHIYVIVDADIICPPHIIQKSVHLLNQHSWIIPYTKIQDISRETTLKLLNRPPSWPLNTKIESKKRKVVSAGGINIMHKQSFEAIKGFDERFVGWGGEDDAFACSVDTIVGKHRRLNANIFHLWHPNNQRYKHPHYKSNLELAIKYCNARNNKMKMKQIINER